MTIHNHLKTKGIAKNKLSHFLVLPAAFAASTSYSNKFFEILQFNTKPLRKYTDTG